MATVDIEPASLAVTPGEPQTLTLTVQNDGEDVEAYRLSVVDDAAPYVVMEPDTVLVRPGETATATATITLEHTRRWRQGDLIVRFHVVPAGQPDAFLVVEAIATVQSFSDVAAVLSPVALEGRRRAAAEVTIANAGNTATQAEVSVSSGELVLIINKSRVDLPPNSTETVELGVRARSTRWRGEPVQHPFAVTVAPEDAEAISLSGTFTQLPVFARWAFIAAISAGAVAVAALLVWAGAGLLGAGSSVQAESTPSATASETPQPPPEPDVRTVLTTDVDDTVRAGDPVVVTLEPTAEEVPRDSLLAVEVEWPEGLSLASDDCEAWVAADRDRVLEGAARSGDECIIDLSTGRTDAELTFDTTPAGVEDVVNARATRLVTLDDDEATSVETGPASDFGAAASVDLVLEPYLFWLEVVDGEPSDGGPDATVIIHHIMRGDGTDPIATMAFQIVPPPFVEQINTGPRCQPFEDSTCSLPYDNDPGDPTNTTYEVGVWFEPEDARGVGSLSVVGTALTSVASNEVAGSIRGAEGIVVSDRLYDVDVSLDSDEQPGQAETVTATVEVLANDAPADVAYREGSATLGLELAWPPRLVPVAPPTGCSTLTDRLCTLPNPGPGESSRITMRFTVDDSLEGGEVRATGVALTHDPTTAADRRDGREQAAVTLPAHWIGTNAEWFPQ